MTPPSDPYRHEPQPGDAPYLPGPEQPYGPPISPPYGQPPVSPGFPYQYSQPAPQISYLVKAPTSSMAVTSMVLGIVGVLLGCCTFGVPSILAIILGHIGLKETSSGGKDGHGMAVTGLILGYIGAAPAIFFSVTWFVGMLTNGTAGTSTP
jgi:hypothetical protein